MTVSFQNCIADTSRYSPSLSEGPKSIGSSILEILALIFENFRGFDDVKSTVGKADEPSNENPKQMQKYKCNHKPISAASLKLSVCEVVVDLLECSCVLEIHKI